MIIDSYQHVFWHHRDDTGLIADMDENNIDLAWLLTWEIAPSEDIPTYHGVLNPEHLRSDGTHAGIPLSDVIKARDRYPGRFLLGYCPHPLRNDAPALLEAAHRMHGARVCGEWKFQIPFDDPRCINLYRKAGELGMPIVLHLDVPFLHAPDRDERIYQSEWYGGTVDHLERALLACADTTFIGHAPGFWREISGDAEIEPEAYRRTDTPGLWATLASLDGTVWVNHTSMPLWGHEKFQLTARTENMAHNFNVLRFGAPSLTKQTDGLIYVMFWCYEDHTSVIRSFQLSI